MPAARALLPAGSRLCGAASSSLLGPARPGPECTPPGVRPCVGGSQAAHALLCHVCLESLGSSGAKPRTRGGVRVRVRVGVGIKQSGRNGAPARQTVSAPLRSAGLGAREERAAQARVRGSDAAGPHRPPARVSRRAPAPRKAPYLGCGGIRVSKLRVGHGARGPGPAGGAGEVLRRGGRRGAATAPGPPAPRRWEGEAEEPVTSSTRPANFSNPVGK